MGGGAVVVDVSRWVGGAGLRQPLSWRKPEAKGPGGNTLPCPQPGDDNNNGIGATPAARKASSQSWPFAR